MDCLKCGHCCRHSIIDEVLGLDLVREPKLRPHVEPVRSDFDGDTMLSRYLLRTPCPFLGEDNLCSIYATRPTVCVTFVPGEKGPCRLHAALEQAEDPINQLWGERTRE